MNGSINLNLKFAHFSYYYSPAIVDGVYKEVGYIHAQVTQDFQPPPPFKKTPPKMVQVIKIGQNVHFQKLLCFFFKPFNNKSYQCQYRPLLEKEMLLN